MKCQVIIDPLGEEKIVIHAKEETPLVAEIRRLVEEDKSPILGYKDGEIFKLDLSKVEYFSVVQNKVVAFCQKEQYFLKERLYFLEEKLPEHFIKINQSCIANIRQMERFDTSISGTLKIHFKNGGVDYVSRRQLKKIKERIGI